MRTILLGQGQKFRVAELRFSSSVSRSTLIPTAIFGLSPGRKSTLSSSSSQDREKRNNYLEKVSGVVFATHISLSCARSCAAVFRMTSSEIYFLLFSNAFSSRACWCLLLSWLHSSIVQAFRPLQRASRSYCDFAGNIDDPYSVWMQSSIKCVVARAELFRVTTAKENHIFKSTTSFSARRAGREIGKDQDCLAGE